ncbi:MAG: peptidoglycan DD-metalloendopeptidase family protein [Bacteroidaceae bacterium]|nr:peptidoglycan DD-metalloendopeptidase family protein [Bacteroidaceae bacterium]
MRLRIAILLLISGFAFNAYGQTSIEQMRKERAEMEAQIAEQEKILTSTEKSISSQISNLNIIAAKLKERTKLLEKTRSEVRALDRESSKLQKEIEQLEKEHSECKQRYADACLFYQHQNSSFNPLMFILASENFLEMRRRARYVSEYSGSLREMADEISQKRDTLADRKSQVEQLKEEKTALQKIQQQNEEAARKEEKEQQAIVDQLKKKRSSLKNEIAAKQKKADALSKEIDRQIQLALKEEQAKIKQIQQTEVPKVQEENVKLTGTFESNKGRLPMPITGSYLVVGEYGVHNVPGMKDVKQNNLGLEIQGQEGAQARAVFDGVVSQIFQQGKGQIGVLIRHGSYISVYCNLSETRLKKDDKVKTQDIIGNIQTSDDGFPVLHFELHKETERLNPSQWLRR